MIHGCQMAIARFLDPMRLAIRASGLWLRYATLQNLIPSFPWIAPPALHPGAIQGKEGIKFCHLATLVCSALRSPLMSGHGRVSPSLSITHKIQVHGSSSLSHGHTVVRIVVNDLHYFLNLYLLSCFSFAFLKYYSTFKGKTR